MNKSVSSIRQLYKSSKIYYFLNTTFVLITNFIFYFWYFWSVNYSFDMLSSSLNSTFALARYFNFSIFLSISIATSNFYNLTNCFSCLTDNITYETRIYMKKVCAWKYTIIERNIFSASCIISMMCALPSLA